MAQGNSNNHRNVGQNVVYVDGHVEWWDNPFCGPTLPGLPYRDNIFTSQSGINTATGAGGAVHDEPQAATDVVMDPCEGAK